MPGFTLPSGRGHVVESRGHVVESRLPSLDSRHGHKIVDHARTNLGSKGCGIVNGGRGPLNAYLSVMIVHYKKRSIHVGKDP